MWWLILIGAGIYLLSKKESGLGAAGTPRFGRPKSEEERKKTHLRRFGTEELPPRGTGVGGKRGEGLGVGGGPRLGQPKSEEERRKTHERRYGSAKLPPRGTGLGGCSTCE